MLADGAVFEGEAVGAPPDGGVATGEAVFNTVLSGYQEVITDPSYAGQVIAFTYPHIGNYGVNPTDDEAARPPLPGGDRARPHRPAQQLAVDRVAGGLPDPRRGARHHRRRHPPAHPPSARPGGHALRLRHRRRARPAAAAAAAAPSTDGRGPGVHGDHADQLHPGPRPVPGGGLRLRDQRGHAAPAGRAGHRHRGARPRPRPTQVLDLEPDGVFLSNGPGRPGRPRSRSSAEIRALVDDGTVPGVRHLPRPPAAGHRARRAPPTSCPSATTAGTTRCAAWPPAGSRSPRRTTTTRWPRTRWPRPRSPTSTSTTG